MNSPLNKVLIIKDEQRQSQELAGLLGELSELDFIYRQIKDFDDFTATLNEQTWDLILCDFKLQSLSPETVLKHSQEVQPQTPVIMMADNATVADAVNMLRMGACNFVEKGNLPRLTEAVREVIEKPHGIDQDANPYRDQGTGHKYKSIMDDLQIKGNAIATSITAIAIADPGYIITYVNPAFLKLWRYANEQEIIGKPIAFFWQNQAQLSVAQEQISQQGYSTGTMSSCLNDGSYADIEYTAHLVTGDDGQPVCFMTSFIDITERVRTEKALKSSEEKFSKAFSASSDYVVISSVEEGLFLEANESFLKITGYSRSELIGHTAAELEIWVKPEQRAEMVRTVKSQGYIRDFEMQLRCKSGEFIDVLFSSNLIEIDGRNRLLSVLRDITESKKVEKRLRDSEAQQKALIEAIPDLLFRMTPDGIFVSFHGPIGGVIMPPELFIGKRVQETLPPSVATQTLEAIHQVNLTHQPVVFEYELFFQDTPHFYEARLVPLEDSRDVLAIIRDITERKKAEADLRASEEKYRSLINSADAVIAMFDYEGRWLYANDIAASPLGLTSDEMVGKYIQDLFPADQAEYELSAIREVISSGTGEVHDAPIVIGEEEQWFHTSIQPVKDAQDKIMAALVFSTNISEKIKAEREILLQNELIHQSVNFIGMSNLEGVVSFINQGAARMMGAESPESQVGTNIAQYHPAEDAARVRDEYLPYAMEHGQWVGENRIKTLDGRLIIVEQNLFPIWDRQGNLVQIATIMTDITERKKAEEKIRASEEKYRSLIESSDAAISMISHDGHYLYLNQIAAQPYGVAPEQLIGKTVEELFPPDDAAQIMTDIDRIIKDNCGKTLEVEVTLAGEQNWFRTSIQPVRDSAGKPYAAMLYSTNITERKKAELAVLLQTELLRQSGDFIGMADDKGVVTFINQGAATMMGADSPESLIGTHISQYHPPEDAARIRDEGLPYSLAHGQWRGENRLKTLDGRLIDVEQNLFPIRDKQGNFVQIATIMTDITERKKVRAALEEANALLEQRVAERTAELERVYDRLEAIFNHSGDSILLLNLQQGIQQANYTFESLFETGPERYLGKPLDEFFHPDSLSAIRTAVKEVADSHRKRDIEVTTNSGVAVEIGIAPVNRSDKAVSNLVCIIRDITERKQAEAAAKKYAAEIHDLYNKAPTGYHSLVKDGTVVKINDTELSWLGYSREEIIGKVKAFNMLTPESQEKYKQAFPQMLEKGVIKDLELELIRKDGTILPVIVNAAAVYDELGNFLYTNSSLTDNTELEKAKQALAEERNLLRTVIDTVPDYIYLKDAGHRLLMHNLAHAHYLNLSNTSAAIGKTVADYYPAEIAARLYEEEEQVMASGQALLNIEEQLYTQNGPEIWALTTKVPLRNLNGELIGLVGITHDITDLKAGEQALRESEERYRTTITAMSEGLLLLNADSSIQFYNKTAEQILGLYHDAAAGRTTVRPDWRAIHEDGSDFPRQEQPAMVSFQTGQPQANVVMGVYKPDGTLVWLLVSSQPLFDYNQTKPYAVVITFADISDRKRIEDFLEKKRQEELQTQAYLKALHNITITLTRTETLDDFYHCVVEHGLKSFGFERMGLLLFDHKEGSAVGTYGTDENGNLVDEHDLRLSPENLTTILKRTLDRNERFVFEPDIDLYTNLRPIGRGQNAVAMMWNGRALGWLCIDNAVTQKPISQAQLDILALYALTAGSLLARKHAEFALRESEEKFRQFIESAPISAIIVNQEGRIVLINKEAENLFGYDRAELQGQKVEILVPENLRENDKQKRSEYFTSEENRATDIQENYGRRKDGSVFPVDFKLSYIESLEGPLVMTFVIDITQRKRAEQALKEALEQEKELGDLKSRFVSTASHEFRTPMAAILATTETLSTYRARMNDEQIDIRLGKIKQQVLHMKDIMEDVLQLARMQAGRVDFKPEPGDLNRLCLEIIEEFESQPQHQGRIRYVCAASPVTLEYDSRLMRQVINNLISNALKYSPSEKAVRVELSLENEQVRLKVEDEGIGIPPEDLKRLFEPFHRATNVGTIAGTGLGLSIARQSVVIHGGRLAVESQVGIGTTMIMSLPVPTST